MVTDGKSSYNSPKKEAKKLQETEMNWTCNWTHILQSVLFGNKYSHLLILIEVPMAIQQLYYKFVLRNASGRESINQSEG